MAQYLTNPSLCFLNHGSFGSTPQELLDLQTELRLEMERSPVDFLGRNLFSRIEQARRPVADFLRSDIDGTVFVHNATTGVNAILASFPLAEGDEVLITNHRYDAVRNTIHYVANRRGASVIEANVPFPINSAQQIIDAIEDAVTERTRLLVIDHITSPTALIFPVNEIVSMAHKYGIPIMIDAAHAPGQVDVDLDALQPDFWVGNLHKWLCAPKGCAVLYVSPEWRSVIHPTVISHGYEQGFVSEFDTTGTLDPTAWMCAPAAIKLHQEQGGEAFRQAHHTLVREGRSIIAEALSVDLPHPDDPTLYGSMATIPLPCTAQEVPDLFNRVRNEDGIEVPILRWNNRAWTRISGFAAYNTTDQYVRLGEALRRRLIDA